MTRAQAKKLQKTYGMEILRHPITREAWGLGVSSATRIPELEELADVYDTITPLVADHGGEPYCIYYTLVCPTSWFDLWGWADE